MKLDLQTYHAFLFLAYMEGRTELYEALLKNADLFEDGTEYTLERKKPELKLVSGGLLEKIQVE